MAGIYIHIPFCKQACHYCDFHFSTSLSKKTNLIFALIKELVLRKLEFKDEVVESIYFGGGTPSILKIKELNLILDAVFANFKIINNPEITIEANPDDLTDEYLFELSKTRINRLSIGIQSFFDDDLKIMNRAHSAEESKKCLAVASRYFDNISIDLIYGIPEMSVQKWLTNVETALSFGVLHISSYALTVEPKTALKKMIATGKINQPTDELALEHFEVLVETLEKNNFVHYELSNFGKPNYFSKNNSSYWLGKKYIGIGPSAHSFNGRSRSWNVSNNNLYIKEIDQNALPSKTETLSITDLYNEYVMTGLRTIWGVSTGKVEKDFGEMYSNHLLKNCKKFLNEHLLIIENDILKPTQKGKFLCDGIASDLFYLDK